MIDIKQTVNPDRSFVMGRNGLWKFKKLHVWQTGDGRVVFDCISRSDRVLNAGFGIDCLGFEQLVGRLSTRLKEDTTTDQEKELIYFALSRLLDEPMDQEEFNEIDNLRDKFKDKK